MERDLMINNLNLSTKRLLFGIDVKLVLLGCIAAIILGILASLYYLQSNSFLLATKKPHAPVPIAMPNTPLPFPTPIPTPTTKIPVSVIAVEKSEFTSLLIQELEASGFFKPEFITSTSAESFSATIPSDLEINAKNTLMDILAASLDEFSITEKSSVQDVQLQLGEVTLIQR